MSNLELICGKMSAKLSIEWKYADVYELDMALLDEIILDSERKS